MDVKYRNEIKYVCSAQQLALVEERIKAICGKDAHAGKRGVYAIRSVYFDDLENSCFYENENGTDPREKYRIRIYNGDSSYIRLECKQKKRGMTRKLSCPFSRAQCEAALAGKLCWASVDGSGLEEEERKLLNRFLLQYCTRPLRAKVIVEYERTPYIYRTGNVRITFDRYVSGSRQVGEFLKSKLPLRPVMVSGDHVLEVKYDELLPDYLYDAMQIGNMRQSAYSKYYVCRKFCG